MEDERKEDSAIGDEWCERVRGREVGWRQEVLSVLVSLRVRGRREKGTRERTVCGSVRVTQLSSDSPVIIELRHHSALTEHNYTEARFDLDHSCSSLAKLLAIFLY